MPVGCRVLGGVPTGKSKPASRHLAHIVGPMGGGDSGLISAQPTAAQQVALGKSERGGGTRFWLTLLQCLQPAIACKQCQLIIDFATKLLACHAGAATNRGPDPGTTVQ